MTGRLALPMRAYLPLRARVFAVLVALALGAALYVGLPAGGGQPAPPAGSAPGTSGRGATRVGPDARASISAALGVDSPAYHLTQDAGAVRGANAAQRLRIDFARSGVLLSTGGGQLGLRLRAEGAAGSLRPVGTVAPELERSNRVAYVHEGITEWYVNGPLGLEQGFSVARPAGPGALTLGIGVSGASRVALAPGGQSALLRDAGGDALRYGGLSAQDASGRSLRTWMTISGQLLLLHLDTRGARFPISVDPLVEQEPEQKLNAESEKLSAGNSGEPAERSRFGWSVALSGEGDTALVGAPGEDGGAGAAWIFVRSGNGWTQKGSKLVIPANALDGETCRDEPGEEGEEAEEEEPPEEPGEEAAHPCHFGRSVALSQDGSTAVIGAPRENGNAGAVWIFTRIGAAWTAATELRSPEPTAKRRFGVSVAASADGSTLAVGAPRLGSGRVWTFARSGAGWSPIGGPITGAGEQGDGFFGQSVALSADGGSLLVGAPSDDARQGAAWAFTRSGSSWTEAGTKLTPSGASPEAHFGSSVAMSGDASTAAVGAHGADEGTGAAWVYSNTGAGWVEQGPALHGEGEAGEAFGDGVALSYDGAIAVVGADEADGHRGRSWLFQRAGGSWGAPEEQLGAGLSGKGAIRFGSGVALSADAETALVGAHSEEKTGAAWVFGPRPSVAAVTPDKGSTSGGTQVTISGEHLTGATAVRFGSNVAPNVTISSTKSIVAESPPGVGSVDVTVETPIGVSATNTGDLFTYTGKSSGGGGSGAGGEGGPGQGPGQGVGPGQAGGSGSAGDDGGLRSLQSGSETVVLGFGPAVSPACNVSLVSGKVAIQAHYRAGLRLKAAGSAGCRGRLTLEIKLTAAGRRHRTKAIGTVSFSLAAGRSATFKLGLNAFGRARMRVSNGHLSATLVMLKSAPAPARTRTASVRLALAPGTPKTSAR